MEKEKRAPSKASRMRISVETKGSMMGSESLLFLPYLSGERTPYPDPHARGSFVGLTVRHGLAHMVRAVLEPIPDTEINRRKISRSARV